MSAVWFSYLHHVTVHFPIVLTLGLAAIGIFWLVRPTDELAAILRWGGWSVFGLTTIAVVSGFFVAEEPFTGDSSPIRHHRDLAVTTWCIVGLATWGFERGLRDDHADWRRFAALLWCVAALSTVGTAHWGGSTLHDDVVPWHDDKSESNAPATD